MPLIHCHDEYTSHEEASFTASADEQVAIEKPPVEALKKGYNAVWIILIVIAILIALFIAFAGD